MAELNLTFTYKDGRFCLCVTVKGTTIRHYRQINELENPIFRDWDKKTQRFNGSTISVVRNNQKLLEIKEHYQQLIKRFKPSDGKELFKMEQQWELAKSKPKPIRRTKAAMIKADKSHNEPPMFASGKQSAYDYDMPVASPTTETTVGDYIRWLIYEMRHERIKKPSRNYQVYVNLLHKLEMERRIINVPISQVDNALFIRLGKWILSLPENKGRSNFKEIMKRFKAVHNKAFEHELNNNVLRYKYSKDAPTRKAIKRKTITEAQYEAIKNMDLSGITQYGRNSAFLKELYRDFSVFLYEMKIRPVDAIKLHSDDIISVKGKRYIHYIPEKKKNYATDNEVFNEITETAEQIIKRYAGRSSQGYVFPFAINEHRWNFDDPDSWNHWSNRKNTTLEKVRLFMKKVAKVVGFDPKDWCNYTMRHSTFTHEINKNEKPLLKIAKEGGTGVEMLEMHYYSYINL